MLIHINFLNKFILLLRKFVYLYEYMDDWENFNETSPHEIEDFHSYLNMEDITEADYTQAKRVAKDFEIKRFGKYHGLHVQSDTLLLPDAFSNHCTKNDISSPKALERCSFPKNCTGI